MFTLIRHRNGQEVPIKISVLDVFRSGSRRDKKPGEELHLTKPKANSKATITSKSQGNGGGANNNKSNSNADTSNTNNATNTSTSSWSTSPPETWTAEDDAILHDLKPKNTSWKAILIALGDGHTSESQAKARWKEIEGKPVAGAGSDGGGTDKKDEDKKAKADKARADGLAKQAAGKGKGKGGGSDSGQQMGKKGILKGGTFTTTSTASQEKDVKSVAAKYDSDKWLSVASRHFDRTGQRISPEMAKAMCRATD